MNFLDFNNITLIKEIKFVRTQRTNKTLNLPLLYTILLDLELWAMKLYINSFIYEQLPLAVFQHYGP